MLHVCNVSSDYAVLLPNRIAYSHSIHGQLLIECTGLFTDSFLMGLPLLEASGAASTGVGQHLFRIALTSVNSFVP